jgi:hypothetical protein
MQGCQTCHFKRVAGGGQAVKYDSKYGEQHRDYFVSHSTVGGSTWVQDAIYAIWKGKDLNREALETAKTNARALLRTAAALNLECRDGKARLTITNLTGHKLPTGYPEGRRMWVNMRFFDAQTNLVGELGLYQERPASLAGQKVAAPTLVDPEKTKVYECKPGISAGQAAKYNQRPGPSFHFILNDVVTKDDRIPPRGYQQPAFAAHLAAPVEADYPDGQYWDTVEFAFPSGTERVEARLMYQSVSWEYLKFLVEENHTDEWGKKLYAAWQATGKCPPEQIAFASAVVKP